MSHFIFEFLRVWTRHEERTHLSSRVDRLVSEQLSSQIPNFIHNQYHSNHQNGVNSISNNFGYNKNTCGISMICTFRSEKLRTLRSDYPLPNTKMQMKIGVILASSWSPLKNTKKSLCKWRKVQNSNHKVLRADHSIFRYH
jgi:hypothetical protein